MAGQWLCDAVGEKWQRERAHSVPDTALTTAPQMLYWSMLVYRLREAGDDSGVTLEGGMKLYGLQHFELLHERVLDTKALMAWNHDTVVLSFRGTVTYKNVLAGAASAQKNSHDLHRATAWQCLCLITSMNMVTYPRQHYCGRELSYYSQRIGNPLCCVVI